MPLFESYVNHVGNSLYCHGQQRISTEIAFIVRQDLWPDRAPEFRRSGHHEMSSDFLRDSAKMDHLDRNSSISFAALAADDVGYISNQGRNNTQPCVKVFLRATGDISFVDKQVTAVHR